MTIARKYLVDHAVTWWYNCISHCVRAAFLINVGQHDRRQWIEKRQQKLDLNFAVSFGGFSAMYNHLHVLCRIDPAFADPWPDKEVIQRWIGRYTVVATSRTGLAASGSLKSSADESRSVY